MYIKGEELRKVKWLIPTVQMFKRKENKKPTTQTPEQWHRSTAIPFLQMKKSLFNSVKTPTTQSYHKVVLIHLLKMCIVLFKFLSPQGVTLKDKK